MAITKVDLIKTKPDIEKIVAPGFRILVLPDQETEKFKQLEDNADVVQKEGSKILLLAQGEDMWKEKQQVLMQNSGIVISIGRTAFKIYDDGVPWCQTGDRVFFRRYCGEDIMFSDNKIYKLIEDRDVLLVEPKTREQ